MLVKWAIGVAGGNLTVDIAPAGNLHECLAAALYLRQMEPTAYGSRVTVLG